MPRTWLAALLAVLLGSAASAQERTVRVISGFAAGGASDFVARIVADAVGPALGARAVVENRTGANGVIGAAEVARSAPDGNTVYQCPMSTLAIAPQLVGANLPMDPGAELAPIANVAMSSYGFVVAANGPYKSVQEVIAAARARPGAVTFGSAGVGSAQHLSGELLKQRAGVDMTHVPYRGATPSIIDIMGGRTDFMITNLADAAGRIQDGNLRLLALADDTPSPVFPDTPPLSRLYPGFEVLGWFGICGPKGMPSAIVERWSTAIRQAMQDPAFLKRLSDTGLTPHYEGPAELGARIEHDRQQWREVIQGVNVRAE
jgi:tripartite-type tricarboxylate transporter receptor subunit TctC